MVKDLPANTEDTRDSGLIPGLGKSPRKGNGNPLQSSCPGNSYGWRSLAGVAHGVTESDMTEHTVIHQGSWSSHS